MQAAHTSTHLCIHVYVYTACCSYTTIASTAYGLASACMGDACGTTRLNHQNPEQTAMWATFPVYEALPAAVSMR